MSATIVHLSKTQKKLFVNKLCVTELKALKFLIQKKTMVMLTSDSSQSLIFHSGKSYVKKITVPVFTNLCQVPM